MPSTYVTEDRASALIGLKNATPKGGWLNMLVKAGMAIFDVDKDRFSTKNSWKRSTSIARLSKDLIMSFPTVCTNVIDPKTAVMINKAIERKNITFLQLIAANYHLTGASGADVIKTLHTNMGVKYNVDEYLNKAIDLYNKISEVRAIDGTHYSVIQEEMKQLFVSSTNKRYPVSSFSEHSVNNFKINRDRIFVVTEDYNQDKLDLERKKLIHQVHTDTNKSIADGNRQRAQEEKWNKDEKYKKKRDKIEDKRYEDELEREREKEEYRRGHQYTQDRSQYFQKQLLDSDVKKANELMPTLISLRYQLITNPQKNKGSEDVRNYIEEEIIAGVKSRMIAVPSEEITDRIIAMKKHGVNMTNLIRATTKETSFCKDFIGSIEMAKIDAKRDSKLSKTNPIWRSLQARSNKSKVRRLISKSNTAAAITTLVVTKQEVEMVKNQYDIDLSNPVIAVDFMDTYNLMGLVIVDEPMEVAEFIYDGDAYFETISFAGLEKENNGVNARQIVSLLNTRR